MAFILVPQTVKQTFSDVADQNSKPQTSAIGRVLRLAANTSGDLSRQPLRDVAAAAPERTKTQLADSGQGAFGTPLELSKPSRSYSWRVRTERVCIFAAEMHESIASEKCFLIGARISTTAQRQLCSVVKGFKGPRMRRNFSMATAWTPSTGIVHNQAAYAGPTLLDRLLCR